MVNQNLARGLVLLGISVAFGLGALRYRIGDLAHPEPGLLPLIVSCFLFVIALATIIQSRLEDAVPLQFSIKSIGFIIAAILSFVLLSEHLNMIAAICALVFISTLAAPTYSVVRNLQISLALIAIAFAFKQLLDLNLHLI